MASHEAIMRQILSSQLDTWIKQGMRRGQNMTLHPVCHPSCSTRKRIINADPSLITSAYNRHEHELAE